MNLRLNGSKIKSISPDENAVSGEYRRPKPKSGLFSRWWAAQTVGFVYVIRTEYGLVKVGSCLDPVAMIARLRKVAPYQFYVDYLGFTRADLSVEVEWAAHEALARSRVQPEWFDCAPELAIAAIQTASRGLGFRMIRTDLEGVDDVVRNASRVTVSRFGLMRARQGYGEAIALGMLGSLLALAIIWKSRDFDLHPMVGLGILIAMVAAFVLGRQRSATGRI